MSHSIINVKTPTFINGRRQGLWIVTYEDDKGRRYDAHLNKTGYELAIIKDKLEKQGYDMNLINEFEWCVLRNANSE